MLRSKQNPSKVEQREESGIDTSSFCSSLCLEDIWHATAQVSKNTRDYTFRFIKFWSQTRRLFVYVCQFNCAGMNWWIWHKLYAVCAFACLGWTQTPDESESGERKASRHVQIHCLVKCYLYYNALNAFEGNRDASSCPTMYGLTVGGINKNDSNFLFFLEISIVVTKYLR